MHRLVRSSRSLLLGGVALFFSGACMPVPDSNLTSEQKVADMMWLYSMFDENYAPLEYKMEKFGFNYQELKKSYLDQAVATPDNESFYRLMHRFVAQFRDAHTSGSFSHGGLPNRAQIAYLGITGKRQGNVFVVKELLPSYAEDSYFPIKKGDEIEAIDGKSLNEIIQNEIKLNEDIGQDDANLTFHMNRIFNRVSLDQELPKSSEAVLKIVRREYTEEERNQIEESQNVKLKPSAKKKVDIEVSVPWIVKDVYKFRKDQRAALSAKGVSSKTSSTQFSGFSFSTSDIFRLDGENGQSPVSFAFRGFDGSIKSPLSSLMNSFRHSVGTKLSDSFAIPNQIEGWTIVNDLDEEVTVKDKFKENRFIPSKAIFVTSDDATYPTYFTRVGVGESSNGRLVATMYLNTFSPKAEEADVLKEFNTTLENLKIIGVKDLVIDLMNNGGGSLFLGMKLAQALSSQKVVMPWLEIRNSQTWRDEFLQTSLRGSSDAEKVIARKIYDQLKVDQLSGKRLSSRIRAEDMVPFQLIANSNLKNWKFNIVLLTNEMCASMCDIFAGILQDNGMAKSVGARTMGAGGNVVAHYFAPNSHFIVNQTESLIVRAKATKDGPVANGYIENNGVVPDKELVVSEYAGDKYRYVLKEGIQKLFENENDEALKGSVKKKSRRDQVEEPSRKKARKNQKQN